MAITAEPERICATAVKGTADDLKSEEQYYFESFPPVLPPRPPPNQYMSQSPKPEPAREPLFLAILLEPSLFQNVARRARLTCDARGLTQRPIDPERLHISLVGFGNYNSELAAKICRVAASVRYSPIEIRMDEALSFPIRGRNKHPFVLTSGAGLEGVRAFFQHLSAAFFGTSFKPVFTPHMTLIWDSKVIPGYALTKPLSWTASEFALVRSYHGQSRYDMIGRWPLAND